MGRASLLSHGDNHDGSPGVTPPTSQSPPAPCARVPHAARVGPTFRDSRILPGGPGRAGSRLLQELGSNPQPTRALGRGIGLGTRGAAGRAAGSGGARPGAPARRKTSQQTPASLPDCLASYPRTRGVGTPHRVTGVLGERSALCLVPVWLNRTLPVPRAKLGAAGTSGAAPSRETRALLHHLKIVVNKALGGLGAHRPWVRTSLSGSRLTSC